MCVYIYIYTHTHTHTYIFYFHHPPHRLLSSKNLSANTGDTGLILRLGRSPGKKMATHPSILVWEIPWTEEPGWL